MAKFNSTVLSRALLVLYIVYPGVSVAIFQVRTAAAVPARR